MSLLVSAKKSAFGIPSADKGLGPASPDAVPPQGKLLKGGRRPAHSDKERADAAPLPVESVKLDKEVERRFESLIEHLTDLLAKERPHDRDTCRSHAITMLIATGHKLAATTPVSAAVMDRLQQEQTLREQHHQQQLEKRQPPDREVAGPSASLSRDPDPIFTFVKG